MLYATEKQPFFVKHMTIHLKADKTEDSELCLCWQGEAAEGVRYKGKLFPVFIHYVVRSAHAHSQGEHSQGEISQGEHSQGEIAQGEHSQGEPGAVFTDISALPSPSKS